MIKINKGLNIPLAGEPVQTLYQGQPITTVALLGQDYIGLRPQMLVQMGQQVKKGQALFADKNNPAVLYTAPACGTITAINRGEKRVLQSVVITVEGTEQITFAKFQPDELETLSRKQVEKNLLASGLWAALRTRPFSKNPVPGTVPVAIFVTVMDTNPLAGDPLVCVHEQQQAFNQGLTLLSRLTEGKIHVCLAAGSRLTTHSHPQITFNEFSGPHPAGLVGTHIHFLESASLDKIVWHIGYQDVIAIGKLFTTGELYTDRVIALAGPQVNSPCLLRTCLGASLHELTATRLREGRNRLISGSVLSGTTAEGPYSWLGRFHNQVSVLPEGGEKKLFGWFMPGFNKFSITRTTVGHFFTKKRLALTTDTNGGKRAMVPIGNYERVMPLDILPTLLLRDLLSGDVESAMALGCLELDEEDLSLCTFVCPGKYEYGPALRQILTTIEREE